MYIERERDIVYRVKVLQYFVVHVILAVNNTMSVITYGIKVNVCLSYDDRC